MSPMRISASTRSTEALPVARPLPAPRAAPAAPAARAAMWSAGMGSRAPALDPLTEATRALLESQPARDRLTALDRHGVRLADSLVGVLQRQRVGAGRERD